MTEAGGAEPRDLVTLPAGGTKTGKKSATHWALMMFFYSKMSNNRRQTSRFADVAVGGATLQFRATGREPLSHQRWARPDMERDAY